MGPGFGMHQIKKANNESGFTGLPAGYRKADDGLFLGIGDYATFWSRTEMSLTQALAHYISYDSGIVISGDNWDKRRGFSIRCIKN